MNHHCYSYCYQSIELDARQQRNNELSKLDVEETKRCRRVRDPFRWHSEATKHSSLGIEKKSSY